MRNRHGPFRHDFGSSRFLKQKAQPIIMAGLLFFA
jgi:hypothetical protein